MLDCAKNLYESFTEDQLEAGLAELRMENRYSERPANMAIQTLIQDVLDTRRRAAELKRQDIVRAAAMQGVHWYRGDAPRGCDAALYVYAGDNFDGELTFTWRKHYGNRVIELSAYSDSWETLEALPELRALMTRARVSPMENAIGIDEFIAELGKLGFVGVN
jgi:hypothetical protein